MIGHAKIIDESLNDSRATYNSTVLQDKIKIHDDNGPDPDWIVKPCYLLIIARATEVFTGVSNFWKSGPSRGRQTYPDFSQYLSENQFMAFCSAALFCWSDKKPWYEDTKDIPWDVFYHALQNSIAKGSSCLRLKCCYWMIQ
jgi:hypothetical protein